jgi:hypothetical protein
MSNLLLLQCLICAGEFGLLVASTFGMSDLVAQHSDVRSCIRRQTVATEKRRDWRALCKAASVEQNSERLMALIAELIKTLDESKEYTTTDSRVLATTT